MRAIKLTTALGLVLTLQACGSSSEDESKLAAADDDSSVLLVVSGGNASCELDGSGMSSPYGMGMYAPFAELKSQLESDGIEVSFLLTCHGANETVYFISSEDKRSMRVTTLDGYGTEVVHLRNTREPKKIYVAGHSYGGWLAMKALLNFDFDLAGFYTIDPISRATCSIMQPFGCQSAPTDFTTEQREQLKARSNYWENFYQTTTTYLHSSAIPQADQNTKIQAGHMAIDSHQTVWSNIAASVQRKLHARSASLN